MQLHGHKRSYDRERLIGSVMRKPADPHVVVRRVAGVGGRFAGTTCRYTAVTMERRECWTADGNGGKCGTQADQKNRCGWHPNLVCVNGLESTRCRGFDRGHRIHPASGLALLSLERKVHAGSISGPLGFISGSFPAPPSRIGVQCVNVGSGWEVGMDDRDRKPRTRLEQLVRQQQLELADFIRTFAQEAEAAGERGLHVSRSQAKRWLQGAPGVPRAASRRVLEYWFEEPVDSLLGPPRRPTRENRAITETELAVDAAHESVSHAIAAASALDPSALELLQTAAWDAARAYCTTPPLEMLTDLVSLRDTIYKQLDRTHKPLQQAHLYLLAGEVCGLLSSVSWDLGLLGAADEQARAAYTYGSIIDHPSVQAWARALQVTAAFWSGHPRRAADIAAAALDKAPVGTARVRLHSVHARALALIGARGEVRDELQLAEGELDRAGDDGFLDEIGGELAFGRARRGLCAGAAYVALGDGDQAEREAEAALELFAAMPEQDRWSAGALGAQVDLGAARTLRGDLAGAQVALAPVFELSPSRRTEAIAQRLHALARVLGTSRYRGAVEANYLGQAIEDFTAISLGRTTAMRALNPPS